MSTTLVTAHTGEAAQATRRRGQAVAFACACVAVSFFWCYWTVLTTLARQWRTNDAFSHGYLVPLISGFLIWRDRKNLATISYPPAISVGALVMVIGVATHVGGRATGLVSLQQFSMLFTLAGTVLMLAGVRFFRAVLLPLAYLLFMMPVWEPLTDRLQYPFQQFTSWLAAGILHAVNVPVLRSDTLLVLSNVTLEVARACSGVNYLVAVLAIGVPLAFLFLQGWTRRVALIALGVITAVLGNTVRVALAGFFAYQGWTENIHGPHHLLQGLSVSLIGYAGLFVGLWALSPDGRRMSATSAGMNEGNLSTALAHAGRRRFVMTAAVIVVLFLAGGAARLRWLPSSAVTEITSALPDRLTGWQKLRFADTLPSASDDTTVVRYASAVDGRIVRIEVSSYAYAEQATGEIRFRNEELWPESSERTVTVPGYGSIVVNELTPRPADDARVVFWYELGSRSLESPRVAKLYTLSSAVLRRSPAPALLLLKFYRAQGDSVAVDRFIAEFVATMRRSAGQTRS